MLNFLKFKGDEGDIGALLQNEDLSPESRFMLGALLELEVVDNFEFTFSQLSQANKAEPFDGGSIKLKFDLEDLNVPPDVLEAELIALLGDSNFQGMLVELGTGEAFLKIGYRNLPFADGGDGPEDAGVLPLTDRVDDLFG